MKPEDKDHLKRIEAKERSILAEQNGAMTKERDRFLQDEQKKLKKEKAGLLMLAAAKPEKQTATAPSPTAPNSPPVPLR